MKRLFACIAVILWTTCPLLATDPADLRLVLLIGQSNMAGRGHIEPADQVTNPRMLMLDKENAWVPARDPVHFDKPAIAGVGLCSEFARRFAAAEPDARIGLIPCAVGGTSLDQWKPGSALYSNAVARTRQALKNGTLAAILWHQGEADSGSAQTIATYPERFRTMIAQLRNELHAEQVPVLVGELGRYRDTYSSFNAMLPQVTHTVPLCALVSSEGLGSNPDRVHFNRDALIAFGARYFAAFDAFRCAAPRPLYATDFDTSEARAPWTLSTFAKWETCEGRGTVLSVDVPAAANGQPPASSARLPLDLTAYRGMRITLFCDIEATDVTRPAEAWNGIKFMLHYRSAIEGEQWRSVFLRPGRFAWETEAFQITLPDDIGAGELTLGLQGSSGRARFDNLRLVPDRRQRVVRPPPLQNPPPAFTGHTEQRLRGAMVSCEYNDENLRTLGQVWGANLIRWQITRDWGVAGVNRDLDEYERWLDGRLADLDKVLAACGRYGMKAVIDLHTPAGGRYEDHALAMFYEKPYADAFVRHWQKIATRYKGNPAVWAYDLVNEPVETRPVPEGLDDYRDLQIRAARAIRAIDPDTTILFEADAWDGPEAFRHLAPIDIPRVVYQVHMYVPHLFTHQKVSNPQQEESRYPGVIGGQPTDKESLRRILQPVRDFQLAYNVQIYAGEFSAIRWAPGACDYLRDCIDLFEEYGWDWSYHAFREWDGWSVEHGNDRMSHTPSATPTDRERLLRDWFSKNQHP